MRMSHFMVKDAIIPDLKGTTREEIVGELVKSLIDVGRIHATDQKDVVEAILRRERLGTTGIGRGIAIPHSRHAAVSQLVGTIGISLKGIPFESLDGEPVHVMFLLISPQDQPKQHLLALENVVSTMKNDDMVDKFKASRTQDEIWALVSDVAG